MLVVTKCRLLKLCQRMRVFSQVQMSSVKLSPSDHFIELSPRIEAHLRQRLGNFDSGDTPTLTKDFSKSKVSSPGIFSQEISGENGTELLQKWTAYRRLGTELEELDAMGSMDQEMRAICEREIFLIREKRSTLCRDIEDLLMPRQPTGDVVLEIRAGTGGSEAALFAANLLDMYKKYAVSNCWTFNAAEMSMDTNGSGIKCAIVFIEAAAFGNQDVADPFILMRHESGVHRVQRVPKTDPHHRIHTSTATVAVLLAAGGEMEELQLRESELRIDQYKSSGPGGQHVNKTNSAIRVVHLPTGMAVAVQSERCAVANKKSALRILKARLQEMEHNRLSASVSADRRRQVGSAERSEKIRTYNWPQARVTDHRTGHTFNNPEIFMNDPHNNLRAIATELDLRERQKYFDQIS